MPEEIIEFWSKFDPHGAGLHLHPDDRTWFERNRWGVEDQTVETFGSYIMGNRYGALDKNLHLSFFRFHLTAT